MIFVYVQCFEIQVLLIITLKSEAFLNQREKLSDFLF